MPGCQRTYNISFPGPSRHPTWPMLHTPQSAEDWLAREDGWLAPYAMRSGASRGRRHPEAEHPYRSVYQRDRERIVDALKAAVADDPAQTYIIPMSALGLVEMTRERRGPGLEFKR